MTALERRRRAAEAAAERLPAAGGPAYSWHLIPVELRLELLDVLDVVGTEAELTEALEARPGLREAVERVVDAAGEVAAE